MNIEDPNVISNQLENTSTIYTTPSYMGGKLEPKKSYKSLLFSRTSCYENLYFNDLLQDEEENEEEVFEYNCQNESYYEIKDGILIQKDSGKEMKIYAKVFSEDNIRKKEEIDFDDNSFLNKKRYFNENIENQSESNNDVIDDKKKKKKVEDLLKAFKSNFLNKYLFNKANELLKNWLKENNYNYTIYKCNYEINIVRTTERNLRQFLLKSFKEIFSIYDPSKKEGIENSKKNGRLFEIIEEAFKDPKQLKLLEDFKKVYESFMEDLLKDYYHSEVFFAFKNKKTKEGKTIKDYDYEFSHAPKRKRPSLLTQYGFIDYAKSEPYCHNQRKIKNNFIH